MQAAQHDHRANLRAALQQSMLLTPYEELRELRHVVRMLSVLLAGMTGYKLMLEPVLLILTTPASLIARAASLTHRGEEVAAVLVLALAMLALYIVQQVMAPCWVHRRYIAKGAVLGLLATSLAWIFLLTASVRMDAGFLPGVLLLNAVCCVGFAGALGAGLNSELARALEGPTC